MLKVGIVGCGKIADAHVSQILRIPGCRIVGVCDREPLMAQQLCHRFSAGTEYPDLPSLLASARPDVVHITTPPDSHFELARTCLEAGTHVYVEKPFTVHLAEARTLVALASARGLRITAGHDDQFTHVARRMRELVRRGYLGGLPVHMESYYCYDLSEPRYARALLGDTGHWVRRLPGKLLQNVISHGIARVAEFFTTECPNVLAHGFVSPVLKKLGETEIVDELRVILSEGERTAYFTFSSQMRPSLHELRLYGPKNGLLLDQDHEILIKLRGSRFKSYVEKFAPPLGFAGQHLANLLTNGRTFLRRDFHMKSGMKFLIESFYQSIVNGGAVPIPAEEILRVSAIMDAIFRQLDAARCSAQFTTDVPDTCRPMRTAGDRKNHTRLNASVGVA